MKKIMISGALAAALIVGGGTGAYMAFAKDNTTKPIADIHHQGMNMNQMMKQMKSGNLENMQQMMKQMKPEDLENMQQMMEEGNMNFGQMKKYMKQMHPDLSNQQLEELYKSMHSKDGACNSKGSKGMMGDNL